MPQRSHQLALLGARDTPAAQEPHHLFVYRLHTGLTLIGCSMVGRFVFDNSLVGRLMVDSSFVNRLTVD